MTPHLGGVRILFADLDDSYAALKRLVIARLGESSILDEVEVLLPMNPSSPA